jgi:hypothetical protein
VLQHEAKQVPSSILQGPPTSASAYKSLVPADSLQVFLYQLAPVSEAEAFSSLCPLPGHLSFLFSVSLGWRGTYKLDHLAHCNVFAAAA